MGLACRGALRHDVHPAKKEQPMIIDCHGHCTEATADDVVRGLDRYGIDKICCSRISKDLFLSPGDMRACNNEILASMRRHPDRILGLCFLHPGQVRAVQDEMTRCIVDGGMVGVKLYHQHQINEPVQFPVIERCIELGVPILMHAGYPGTPELSRQQPRLSTGDHFADVARRYPEAMLICGHIGGGGDWERQIKGLRTAPSVYVDTSGSVIETGIIERCVRDLGIDRLLFGCDTQPERGLGKILDADLTESQRRKIWSGNYRKLLARRSI